MVSYDLVSLRPVGVVRCGFTDRADAPRQGAVSTERAELVLDGTPHAEDLLDGLASFSHVWVVYLFHKNGPSEKPKVQPPRSDQKRGVFATRSPHRPNPIGLSLVELVSIDGPIVRVRGVDMLDGTPVLDLKPYLPYSDNAENASSGWLDEGASGSVPVQFEEDVKATCSFFLERTGIDVERAVRTILEAGTRPHAYRRIKVLRDGTSLLAWKSLRFAFSGDAGEVRVTRAFSGYKPRELHATGIIESIPPGGFKGVDDITLHRAWFSS